VKLSSSTEKLSNFPLIWVLIGLSKLVYATLFMSYKHKHLKLHFKLKVFSLENLK